MSPRGIYLVGFSGSGKSTVARLVAARLGWPALDLDGLVVERSGMEIPAIFEREGESGFRHREAEALRLAPPAPFVMATGGGAVVAEENRRVMTSRGWVVALEGRPETLLWRIQRQLGEKVSGAVRPLLDAPDPLEKVRSLKASRQAAYALADWTVHTDRLSLEQVAAEVLRAREVLEAAEPDPGRPS